MAKRNIPKTDPTNNSASDTRRPTATNGQGTAEEPTRRAPRARRKSDAVQGATAEAASPVTNTVAPAAPELSSAVRVVEVAPPAATVPHEHIAVRAYHIYLERGGRSGDEFEDWIKAERQLRELTSGNRQR
jgi:hypothetical protein